jgi:hypothetical protein
MHCPVCPQWTPADPLRFCDALKQSWLSIGRGEV